MMLFCFFKLIWYLFCSAKVLQARSDWGSADIFTLSQAKGGVSTSCCRSRETLCFVWGWDELMKKPFVYFINHIIPRVSPIIFAKVSSTTYFHHQTKEMSQKGIQACQGTLRPRRQLNECTARLCCPTVTLFHIFSHTVWFARTNRENTRKASSRRHASQWTGACVYL